MPPERISFGGVIRLIDGPLAPIACVSQTAYEPCTCPDQEHCGLHMLMLDVRNSLANILDRYTLADTVELTLRKMRRDRVPLPFLGVIHVPVPMAMPAPARKRRRPGKAAAKGEKKP